MFELSFNNVMKHMGTNLILENLNFQIYAGERVGIVGANGCGKTTILKLIAGLEPLNLYPGSWSKGYDFGMINMPKGLIVAYLDQIPKYVSGLKVKDVLNRAFQAVFSLENKLRLLEHQMETADPQLLENLLKQYGIATQSFELSGGYDIQEKFNKICSGLKFDQSFLDQDYDQLSGGEKTRVELGKLLMDRPDILLLDEPTNHLDLESIEWLESYLSQYSGILIIVSHDRYFLDTVVTKIIEIEDKTAQTFKGNYSSYVSQKEEQMRIQFEDFKEQQKQVQNLENKAKSLREWALKADNNKFFRRAASIQIKLDKMARIEKPIFERRNMHLNLKATQRSGNETIKISGVSKAFEGRQLLKEVDLLVAYQERVALLGSNGSGKTTLLKMLLGELAPDSGTAVLGANVKCAYLQQSVSFKNEDYSVLDCFRDDLLITEGKAREYLAKYMFFGKSVFTKVSGLSGGERVRLKLALLLYEDVNLLILDEPTNHLDIDSIEAFEEALECFKGTILFISHDRYFVNKISQRIVAIEDSRLMDYLGNYSHYKEAKEKISADSQVFSQKSTPIQAVKKSNAAGTGRTKHQKLPLSQGLDLPQIEAQIDFLEKDLEALDIVLMSMEAYDSQLDEMKMRRIQILDFLDTLWDLVETLDCSIN
jgi:ATPase subunit of ABC transporter with duplicated ATPase domains